LLVGKYIFEKPLVVLLALRSWNAMFRKFSRVPRISYDGQMPEIKQNVRNQAKPKVSCHANKYEVMDVKYVFHSNRMQTLLCYLPRTEKMANH
jgi:hypothetical protein